jgi:hypothetical protein
LRCIYETLKSKLHICSSLSYLCITLYTSYIKTLVQLISKS